MNMTKIYYDLRPRYTKGYPEGSVELMTASRASKDEADAYKLALRGALGEGLRRVARKEGLDGIVTSIEEVDGGRKVIDLITQKSHFEPYVNYNIEPGIYYLQKDVYNPQRWRGALYGGLNNKDKWESGELFIVKRVNNTIRISTEKDYSKKYPYCTPLYEMPPAFVAALCETQIVNTKSLMMFHKPSEKDLVKFLDYLIENKTMTFETIKHYFDNLS